MVAGVATESGLHEVLEEGPITRMHARMLKYKRDKFGLSTELTSEEKMRGMEITGLPTEEQIDAILEWASGLHEEQERKIKEEIVKSTRSQAVLTAKLAESERKLQENDEEIVDLKSLVRVDPLTEVLNRRGLKEELEIRIKEIDGNREKGRRSTELDKFSLLFIDIDHFKPINDIFGHDIGDVTLREFANLIKAKLRGSDIIGKYGGEEFVVILEGASEKDAAEKAEELRRVIEKKLKNIILKHCPQQREEVESLDGTISVGLTSYSTESEAPLSTKELIRRADKAMYHSKNTGRNRVTIYGSKIIDPKDEEMAEADLKKD